MIDKFVPTWLYIKQHNKTGLKYFGKTAQKDPYTYMGSGSYWRRHLRKHGNDVSTIYAQLFEDRDELVTFALKFSVDNNIVESKEWANLIVENGLTGNGKPAIYKVNSPETRKKISESNKGRIVTEETKKKIGLANSKKTRTDKEKQHLREVRKNQIMKPVTKEARRNMSKAQKGRHVSNETKEKLRQARKNQKPPSIESRLKIAEATKGTYWWNDGINSVRSKISPGSNWIRGMIKKHE